MKMLRFCLAVSLFMAFCELSAQPQDSGSIQDLFFNGMKQGVTCYRIPALATAPDGTLLAAIDERVPSCKDLGQNLDINIVLRKSFNHGKDWTAVEKVVDFPFGISASDPSFIIDQQAGSIFLFYNYMDHLKERDHYRFQYVQSVDNGITWSDPVDITSEISKPEWSKNFVFITSGNGIQTKEGWLLHTLVHVGEKSGYVFGSDDHGQSWFLRNYPLKPADESKLVELSDGSWMLNARVNGLGKRMIHISADQGNTWTSFEDTSLADPGCNAAILKLTAGKNRPMYFINPASSFSRSKLTLKQSNDDGKTWEVVKVLYEGSSAYSSATILGNGMLGIFFERDDYSKNAFISVPIR